MFWEIVYIINAVFIIGIFNCLMSVIFLRDVTFGLLSCSISFSVIFLVEKALFVVTFLGARCFPISFANEANL